MVKRLNVELTHLDIRLMYKILDKISQLLMDIL